MADAKQLEFSNVRRRRTGDDVQPHPRRGDRRKAIDPLVPDGTTFDDRLPAPAVPYFNSIMLYVLAVVPPFHRQAVIECHRLAQFRLENGMMGSRRRRPESVRIA